MTATEDRSAVVRRSGAAARYLRCAECDQPFDDTFVCAEAHTPGTDGEVLVLAPKAVDDEYDDELMATRYAQYAFGYSLGQTDGLGVGGVEGLYRCVADLARDPAPDRLPLVVDVGCGVGRTTYDLGRAHPDRLVLGLDLSTRLASVASRVCRGAEVWCGAEPEGWPLRPLRRPALDNVVVVQDDARSVPGQLTGQAGVVVLNMLLDRLPTADQVTSTLAAWCRVVGEEGTVIVTTPLSWSSPSCWQAFGPRTDWLLDGLEGEGLVVDVAFSGLPYRELLDPNGTHVELPVTVVAARRPSRPAEVGPVRNASDQKPSSSAE